MAERADYVRTDEVVDSLEQLKSESERLPKMLLTDREVASAEAKQAFKELGMAVLLFSEAT